MLTARWNSSLLHHVNREMLSSTVVVAGHKMYRKGPLYKWRLGVQIYVLVYLVFCPALLDAKLPRANFLPVRGLIIKMQRKQRSSHYVCPRRIMMRALIWTFRRADYWLPYQHEDLPIENKQCFEPQTWFFVWRLNDVHFFIWRFQLHYKNSKADQSNENKKISL